MLVGLFWCVYSSWCLFRVVNVMLEVFNSVVLCSCNVCGISIVCNCGVGFLLLMNLICFLFECSRFSMVLLLLVWIVLVKVLIILLNWCDVCSCVISVLLCIEKLLIKFVSIVLVFIDVNWLVLLMRINWVFGCIVLVSWVISVSDIIEVLLIMIMLWGNWFWWFWWNCVFGLVFSRWCSVIVCRLLSCVWLVVLSLVILCCIVLVSWVVVLLVGVVSVICGCGLLVSFVCLVINVSSCVIVVVFLVLGLLVNIVIFCESVIFVVCCCLLKLVGNSCCKLGILVGCLDVSNVSRFVYICLFLC